jgi:hypothetical protein
LTVALVGENVLVIDEDLVVADHGGVLNIGKGR